MSLLLILTSNALPMFPFWTFHPLLLTYLWILQYFGLILGMMMDYQKSYFGLEGLSLTFLNTPPSWISYIMWGMVKGDENTWKGMQTIFTYFKSCQFKNGQDLLFFCFKGKSFTSKWKLQRSSFCFVKENSNEWGFLPIKYAKLYGSKFPITQRISVETDGCRRYFNWSLS